MRVSPVPTKSSCSLFPPRRYKDLRESKKQESEEQGGVVERKPPRCADRGPQLFRGLETVQVYLVDAQGMVAA